MFLFVLFRAGGKTPDPKLQVRSYVDVMLEQNLSKEEVGGSICTVCLDKAAGCSSHSTVVSFVLTFVHVCM